LSCEKNQNTPPCQDLYDISKKPILEELKNAKTIGTKVVSSP
jgi:hypothetical protein